MKNLSWKGSELGDWYRGIQLECRPFICCRTTNTWHVHSPSRINRRTLNQLAHEFGALKDHHYLLWRITILKILEELWKVGIRELGSLADFMLLLLGLRLGGNSMNLSHGPPLGSVCSMLHPILLQILLYIKHVTGKFNGSEELLEVIIHFDGHPGIIWISNVLLWIKVR